jgi:DinB family protein
MTLPTPVETLWRELQDARAGVLAEVEGLSQRQADWRPGDREWSVGEIVHHLTIAEIATGKLTTKLLKEAAAAGAPAVFPHDLTEFGDLPLDPATAGEAPPVVWPEHRKPIGALVEGIRAARTRSRESIEKLAACDPRALRFKHFRLGDLDLAQWWLLQARHDRLHLGQIRDVKGAAGFPRA